MLQKTDELRGLSILVVEDEPETLELVSMVLSNAGATVASAPNAEAAAELLHAHDPDLLVSDLNLPGEDGCALLQRVRSVYARRVPAIALSASASLEDARRALEAGFDVHVAKPVTPEDLIEAVRAVAGDAGVIVSTRSC